LYYAAAAGRAGGGAQWHFDAAASYPLPGGAL
jgi:hypothetical protein